MDVHAAAARDLCAPGRNGTHVLQGAQPLGPGHHWHRDLQRRAGSRTCTANEIAPYFAKIECFCFEEQKLRAGEEVDLPVFFFIDKDVLQDREARDVHDMMLSYTFFSARRNPKTGQLEPDTDLSKYRVGMDELPQRT